MRRRSSMNDGGETNDDGRVGGNRRVDTRACSLSLLAPNLRRGTKPGPRLLGFVAIAACLCAFAVGPQRVSTNGNEEMWFWLGGGGRWTVGVCGGIVAVLNRQAAGWVCTAVCGGLLLPPTIWPPRATQAGCSAVAVLWCGMFMCICRPLPLANHNNHIITLGSSPKPHMASIRGSWRG